jgi:hypothetical protein
MVSSLYHPEKAGTTLNIRFSEVIAASAIPRESIMPFIISFAKAEMKTHISAFQNPK